MLTLLDRYIAKRLLDYLFLGVVVFTLLLFFSDKLLDFMKDLQHYGISWDIALTLVGLQVPGIVVIVIPMAALLATLMVYNNLNNQFELISMRMSGISLYRIAMPAVWMGVLCTVAAFFLVNYVVPLCNQDGRALKNYAISQQNLPATHGNFIYRDYAELSSNDKPNAPHSSMPSYDKSQSQQLRRLIYVAKFNGRDLGYTTIIDLTNPLTLQVVQARKGYWGQSDIQLHRANIYTVASTQRLLNTTFADNLHLQHFIQPPRQVKDRKARDEMSFLGLWQWIGQQKALGNKVGAHTYLALWEKLTIPASALPLVLIAIPLSMTSPRKLNNLGFLNAIIILFFYYLIRQVSAQLGDHYLPPFLAAAMPLIVIFTTAVLLFRRRNQVL